jgi:hypothetical protein
MIIFIARDWRVSVISLALQYIGVFLLVTISWPLQMAAVKIVAGWMSGAILGLAMAGKPILNQGENIPGGRSFKNPIRPTNISESFFRFFAGVMVTLAVVSISLSIQDWVPGIGIYQIIGGLLLIGIGLLQLGFTSQSLNVALGLLSVLGGFEILYAAVEISALVAGLLAGVNLGIALIGAYLINLSSLRPIS